MDPIDAALLQAWNKVAPRLRADPDELQRRRNRVFAGTLARPLRPGCLCLRASDTRLRSIEIRSFPEKAPYQLQPHWLWLKSENISRLCKPVTIDWPGLDWNYAANKLGRETTTVLPWIKKGVFEVKKYNAISMGRRGKPVPQLWARSALDPSADFGRAPDPVFGTLWQELHKRVPDGLKFRLRREPHFQRDPRGWRGYSGRFRGWQFVCPGLPGFGGRPKKQCRRRVDRVYLPMPAPSLLDVLGDAADLLPGKHDSSAPHFFAPACHHCHRIRFATLASREGWNQFISHFTRGLLYGSEVSRPKNATTRRRAFKPHKRPSPRRDRVHELLLSPLPFLDIAARLGLKLATVYEYAAALYKSRGVHSRRELLHRYTPLALADNRLSPVSRNKGRSRSSSSSAPKGAAGCSHE